MRLQEKAARLQDTRGLFLGGPVEVFETAGRLQLITLLRAGLFPDSKVVDIGCGCLRGGYWLIHFLDAGCYFGIEPATDMLEAGLNELLEPDVREHKRPRFDTNNTFDTSVFGEKFDFFLARSIWTHASRQQIGLMLDSFVRDAATGGVFLTSYLPVPVTTWQRLRSTVGRVGRGDLRRRGPDVPERPEESWSPPLVHRRFQWIKEECGRRDLSVVELEEDRLNKQVWLRIERT